MYLEYKAQLATSFDMLHKGPGDTDFTTADDDVIVKTYNASNAAQGELPVAAIVQVAAGGDAEQIALPNAGDHRERKPTQEIPNE